MEYEPDVLGQDAFAVDYSATQLCYNAIADMYFVIDYQILRQLHFGGTGKRYLSRARIFVLGSCFVAVYLRISGWRASLITVVPRRKMKLKFR